MFSGLYTSAKTCSQGEERRVTCDSRFVVCEEQSLHYTVCSDHYIVLVLEQSPSQNALVQSACALKALEAAGSLGRQLHQ